jgi:hypothetical protein
MIDPEALAKFIAARRANENYRQRAREGWEYKGALEIDAGAQVREDERGAWVAAWVWVDNAKEMT